MLEFGNVFENILTIGVLVGLGYIIYLGMKRKGTTNFPFRSLFSKAGDVMKKINVKK